MVALLLSEGVNAAPLDNAGCTPADRAEAMGHFHIAARIREWRGVNGGGEGERGGGGGGGGGERGGGGGGGGFGLGGGRDVGGGFSGLRDVMNAAAGSNGNGGGGAGFNATTTTSPPWDSAGAVSPPDAAHNANNGMQPFGGNQGDRSSDRNDRSYQGERSDRPSSPPAGGAMMASSLNSSVDGGSAHGSPRWVSSPPGGGGGMSPMSPGSMGMGGGEQQTGPNDLLKEAFSSLSIHDKCALSLGVKAAKESRAKGGPSSRASGEPRTHGKLGRASSISSVGSDGDGYDESDAFQDVLDDAEVASMISENEHSLVSGGGIVVVVVVWGGGGVVVGVLGVYYLAAALLWYHHFLPPFSNVICLLCHRPPLSTLVSPPVPVLPLFSLLFSLAPVSPASPLLLPRAPPTAHVTSPGNGDVGHVE